MPSHQSRRDPLPADYQFPTHGVDCDCSTCRDRIVNWFPPVPVTIRNGVLVNAISLYPVEQSTETLWGV